jgi:hypothetical protein
MSPRWCHCLILCLLLYGCATFNTEEYAQVSGLSAMQSEDEGEKNLAAIRALLSEERQRALFPLKSDNNRIPESEVFSWPPDWLAS